MNCVIMAGGSGTRFWPRSREGKSKQFLSIFKKQSLIQDTLNRFHTIIDWNDIYIVARKDQEAILKEHALKVPPENIIYEPVGKNTAPCIGLAALHIKANNQNDIMVVSPADHLIQNKSQFEKAILAGAELVKTKKALVTVGIPPTHPSTGYGYIQTDEALESIYGAKAFSVKTFAEKPNLATAKRFLESGDFYWNSGIFIFSASLILKAIEEFLPELYDGLMEIRKHLDKPDYNEVVQKVYKWIRGISIDYGVLEKARNVFMVRGDFQWNDLGSWEQVYRLSKKDKNKNVIEGNAVLVDSQNSYVSSNKGVVAVLGLDDVVVVQEGGATLVCKRERAEEVKQIVDRLKRQKLKKYL